MGNNPAVLAEGLHKCYGRRARGRHYPVRLRGVALAGLDLCVAEGSVHAVLGPNGAGKTTAVRILTTLLRPDAGRARVLGLDAVADANRLRSRIGLAGQYAAVDEQLTGAENLEMFGRLYRLPPRTARARAAELLERFDLTGAAGRQVRTYSGGMRRRLDLTASLIMEPAMLFLGGPVAADLVATLAWSVGILAVFGPLGRGLTVSPLATAATGAWRTRPAPHPTPPVPVALVPVPPAAAAEPSTWLPGGYLP